jgi:hypothetical protein
VSSSCSCTRCGQSAQPKAWKSSCPNENERMHPIGHSKTPTNHSTTDHVDA